MHAAESQNSQQKTRVTTRSQLQCDQKSIHKDGYAQKDGQPKNMMTLTTSPGWAKA